MKKMFIACLLLICFTTFALAKNVDVGKSKTELVVQKTEAVKVSVNVSFDMDNTNFVSVIASEKDVQSANSLLLHFKTKSESQETFVISTKARFSRCGESQSKAILNTDHNWRPQSNLHVKDIFTFPECKGEKQE